METLSLTKKEQKDAIALLRQEFHDWVKNRNQEYVDKALTVLNPQQQARLREEALGVLGPDDHLQQLVVHLKGDTKPILIYSLDPYPDFTEASIRKQLGLGAAQEQQVRDILDGTTNLAERLAREVEKLPPQEQKRLLHGIANTWNVNATYLYEGQDKLEEKQIEERKKRRPGFAEQPMMKPSIALRKQFEAVLTPKQLALYRDLAVRNFANDMMNDRLMLRMIGASEQQKAELKQVFDDSLASSERFLREMGRRCLEVLTVAQQEALRAEIEAQNHESGGDRERQHGIGRGRRFH